MRVHKKRLFTKKVLLDIMIEKQTEDGDGQSQKRRNSDSVAVQGRDCRERRITPEGCGDEPRTVHHVTGKRGRFCANLGGTAETGLFVPWTKRPVFLYLAGGNVRCMTM